MEEDASGNLLVKGCFDKESISKRKPLCVKKGGHAETVVIIVSFEDCFSKFRWLSHSSVEITEIYPHFKNFS